MSASPAPQYDPAIVGTDGNDFISVETSISFQWVPDPGNSYTGTSSGLDWNTGQWYETNTIGPSEAQGTVTFSGMSSSAPFQTMPTDGAFSFTNGNWANIPTAQSANWLSGWSYDPTTGVLDPNATFFSWDNWIGVGFSIDQASFGTAHWSGNTSDTDYGHWQLVPDIHNVDVFGGSGNDTILGGQGQEMLFGGDGNDLIRASVGDDLLYGGNGDDVLHGGIGRQTLMGSAGNDTIWGGSGAQLLTGDDGQDVLHGGWGPQTLMGGVGNDTLWGGSGVQLLEGSDGGDVLNAGSGNETLYGGAGRDTFVFSTAHGHDVIADFRLGQDIITIASDFAGLKLTQAQDLLPDLSSDAQGNAVLTLGSGFGLIIQHVTLRQVEASPAQIFRIT